MKRISPPAQSILFCLTMMMVSTQVSAAPGVDTMFANFSSSAAAIMNLIGKYVAPMAGLAILWKSALSFKEVSESGGRTSLKTPLGQAMVGALLLSFWGTINLATETMSLGPASGMSAMSEGGGGSGAAAGMGAAIAGVLMFVKMVGLIAVFRGLLMLRAVAEGSQQASIGKAMTHIFFGGAAVNINTTIAMLANTVGMPLPI